MFWIWIPYFVQIVIWILIYSHEISKFSFLLILEFNAKKADKVFDAKEIETLMSPLAHKMAKMGHYKDCFPQRIGEDDKISNEDTCDIVSYCNTEWLIWQCEFTWWFILIIIVSVSFFIIGIFRVCFLLIGRCCQRRWGNWW